MELDSAMYVYAEVLSFIAVLVDDVHGVAAQFSAASLLK